MNVLLYVLYFISEYLVIKKSKIEVQNVQYLFPLSCDVVYSNFLKGCRNKQI